ncbi:hypothetical protein D3C73_937330 [compost metagenome]
MHDTGAVEQYIDRADMLEECRYRRAVEHIELCRFDIGAARQRRKRFLIDIGRPDLCARFGISQCTGPPYPLTGSGHHDHLAS